MTTNYGYNVVTDFSAPTDGVTDASPAFQAAMDAIKADGGGVLLVPPGNYRLGAQVNIINVAHDQQSIVIKGSGSASRIIVDVGSSGIAFSSSNHTNITYQDLVFVGIESHEDDCNFVLTMGNATNATILRCSFLGLWCNGAAVYGGTSFLSVEHCNFLGCAGGAAVLVQKPWGAKIVDSYFLDYGNLAPAGATTKTGHGLGACIHFNQAVTPVARALDSHVLQVARCGFDNGAVAAIKFDPEDGDLTRYDRVVVEDCNVLVNVTEVGHGFVFNNVNRLQVNRCAFRMELEHPFIEILNAKIAFVTNCTVNPVAGVKGSINADIRTNYLKVESCDGQVLSNAAITNILA